MKPDQKTDAVRSTLTALGVGGAALVLTAAAAVPAFAGDRDAGGSSDSHSHSQQAQAAHADSDDGGQQAQGQDQDQSQQSADDQSGTSEQGGQSSSHPQPAPAASAHAHQGSGSSSSGGSAAGSSHQSSHATGANTSTGHNPPGNNGTVKIHSLVNDPAHHNVPHVGCGFAVDFWGFDANQTLNVSFAGQAPTGMGTAIPVSSGTPTSITSTTDAGGGNDYDGELDFPQGSLDFSVLGTPQAQQGYHVKLTVATGQGGGAKYKVFWVQPCTTTAPATSTTTTAGGAVLPATQQQSAQQQSAEQQGGTSAQGGSVLPAQAKPAAPKVQVLGEKLTRGVTPAAAGAAAPGSLPFTGAEIGAFVAAGAAAVGAGAALTVAGRRRRSAAQRG